MGIYSNGSIYGIQIYTVNDDDLCKTLFEKKYDEIMNDEQMRGAFAFYSQLVNSLSAANVCPIFFAIYTECSSTLDPHNKTTFMQWSPISLSVFLETFGQTSFSPYCLSDTHSYL
jgi:hypothetical protein